METDLSVLDENAANTECTKLNFSKKKIVTVKPTALLTFQALQEIDLYGNRLTELPADVFRHCTRLQSINLGCNKLREIPRDLFSSLADLRTIFLYNNALTEIDGDLFQRNPKLEIISIHSNCIAEFPDNTFRNLYELKQLDFSSNQLEKFNFDSLECSRKLAHIWFDQNALTDITDYDKFRRSFPDLSTCSLDGNAFRCSHLQTIVESFERQNIKINGKNRSEGIQASSVFGLKCRSEADYFYNQMKKLEEKVEMRFQEIQQQQDTFMQEMKAQQETFFQDIKLRLDEKFSDS